MNAASRLGNVIHLASLAIVVGCGRPEPASDPTDRTTPGAWNPGEGWRVTQESRIGANVHGGPASFARICDVTLDDFGRVWVADALQHDIRVFEADGRHVRSFGGMGGGPAEFLGVAGMDGAPDGNLWVLDGGNMRFAVYDTTGKLITTRRRNNNRVVSPWPLGFDAQGNLYDLLPVGNREQIVRYGPGLQSSPAPVVRGKRMVGVVQDDDHVESVVVLRLEKPKN